MSVAQKGVRGSLYAVCCGRYWPSTAAYSTIDADSIDRKIVPSLAWPLDLPRPSFIVLLTLEVGISS